MKDRVPQHAGRVRLTPVSGQTDVFDMTMADGATEQGTPLNKATFLKDTTAALYGLTNAVPDDVFSFIGKDFGNMWVWEKKQIVETKTDITENTYLISSSQTNTRIYYSDSVTVDENLQPALNNPSTNAFSVSATNVASYISSYAPCYIRWDGNNTIFYLPQGTTGGSSTSYTLYQSGTLQNNGVTMRSTATVKAKTLSYSFQTVGYTLTPTNTPPVEAGYTFNSLGQLGNFGNKAQIATGSYVGTGTYGSSNPNSLTFDFAPKMVFMLGRDVQYFGRFPYSGGNTHIFVMNMALLTETYNERLGFTYDASTSYESYGKRSADSKTIYWYNTSSALSQCNSVNRTYYYLAIG